MSTFQVGHRVRNITVNQDGFVVGQTQAVGLHLEKLPVIIEGSTRQELWDTKNVELKPKKEQLVKMGGKFKPPKGFPLNI
ncbi:MAG: hypothetical protein CMB76_05920 [Euryarchaeota archaeon]|nr:hypothetical protein [Euryarchaeota archaeon]|tara:strand:- start:431 stop:670 length:240 start_codon:yes stop_codon:yes gene_type:complete